MQSIKLLFTEKKTNKNTTNKSIEIYGLKNNRLSLLQRHTSDSTELDDW